MHIWDGTNFSTPYIFVVQTKYFEIIIERLRADIGEQPKQWNALQSALMSHSIALSSTTTFTGLVIASQTAKSAWSSRLQKLVTILSSISSCEAVSYIHMNLFKFNDNRLWYCGQSIDRDHNCHDLMIKLSLYRSKRHIWFGIFCFILSTKNG